MGLVSTSGIVVKRERESERERKGERESERERKGERESTEY